MTRRQTHQIRHASGEELLVLAILGSPATVDAIDSELDRRARSPHPYPPQGQPAAAASSLIRSGRHHT